MMGSSIYSHFSVPGTDTVVAYMIPNTHTPRPLRRRLQSKDFRAQTSCGRLVDREAIHHFSTYRRSYILGNKTRFGMCGLRERLPRKLEGLLEIYEPI